MGLADVYVNEYTWDGDTPGRLDDGRGQVAEEPGRQVRAEPAGKGSTKVTYDLTVDVGIPVPGLIRRRIQSKIVDTALKDLKKRCEA